MSSDLRRAIREYLAVRRSLGFALRDAEWLLAGFASYLEDRGTARVTTGHALAWATQPAGTHPHWWHQRLAVVRDFARYLATTGQAAEVPPRDLLPACHIRRAPYLFSGADIAGLMSAARTLRPPLRAATYETLVGLLSVTGMRISEAIRLDQDDFDQAAALLAVRHSKHGSSRQVPLHDTAAAALQGYALLRGRSFPRPASAAFFVSIRGTRLDQGCVNRAWTQLVRRAGLEGRGERGQPRIHDLRHSFAVRQLIEWHRQGADVDARLPMLSAVLGHINPASTYWYLQAAPELLAIASERLQAGPGGPR
jgi:integrase/recombinase XerD